MKDVSFEKCDEVEDAFEMNDINEEPPSLPTNDKVKNVVPSIANLTMCANTSYTFAH